MSVTSQLRRQRRENLLAVAHIRKQTTRTGKHALGRIHITAADRRIPKRLIAKAGR